jgi:hypothetical protein
MGAVTAFEAAIIGPGLMPTVPGRIAGQLCMPYTASTGKRSNSPSWIMARAPA